MYDKLEGLVDNAMPVYLLTRALLYNVTSMEFEIIKSMNVLKKRKQYTASLLLSLLSSESIHEFIVS